MKQISDEVLCKYCLGCNKLEDERFIGVKRCKSFCPGYEDWRKNYFEALNKKHRKH